MTWSSEASARAAAEAAIDALCRELAPTWRIADHGSSPLHWRVVSHPQARLPRQGWKIHLSCATIAFAEFIRHLTPWLANQRLSFKFPRDLDGVAFLNSGDAGIEQLGKIVTLYPAVDTQLNRLLDELDELLPTACGPEVPSDLQRRPGALSLRYGIFQAGQTIIDASGTHHHALRLANGELTVDRRCQRGRQPSGIRPPPACRPPQASALEIGQRVSLADLELMVVEHLNTSARGELYLALRLDDASTTLIKTARPGVGGIAPDDRAETRLAREAKLLDRMSSKGLTPALYGSAVDRAETDQWPMLAMQDVRAPTLGELPLEDMQRRLPDLANSLARLHRQGIVHGDITLNNALVTPTGIMLIDLEHASEAGKHVSPAGTPGFRAPESQRSGPAWPSRDVHGLAGCLFQAMTGIPPGLVCDDSRRLALLLANSGQRRAARLTLRLGHRLPHRRPSAELAAQQLFHLIPTPLDLAAPARHLSAAEWRWVRRSAHSAALATRDFRRPGGAGWRNGHSQRDFVCQGINVGAAGIVLGLMAVDTGLGQRHFDEDVCDGATWLTGKSGKDQAAGLFTGNAGVALALSVAGLRHRREDWLEAAANRLHKAISGVESSDLFCGQAGVLFTACLIQQLVEDITPRLATQVWAPPLAAIDSLALQLITRLQWQDAAPLWLDGSTSHDYLGCAHGSAGIALAIAQWGHLRKNNGALSLARRVFQALVQTARDHPQGQLPMRASSSQVHAPGNWCHGTAGLLWAMLQAFPCIDGLEAEARWCVESLARVPPIGTPTCCHGLAGQLELWCMVTTLPAHRALAQSRTASLVRALRLLWKPGGHSPWASDHPSLTTPDLWIGFLGPASALALHAREASAPLLSLESLRWLAAPLDVAAHAHDPGGLAQ